MAAPTLTPEEQREATRFGMYDEEIIADIESRLHEPVACQGLADAATCDQPATSRLKVECGCPQSFAECEGHIAQATAMLFERPVIRCVQCGSVGVLKWSVVPL